MDVIPHGPITHSTNSVVSRGFLTSNIRNVGSSYSCFTTHTCNCPSLLVTAKGKYNVRFSPRPNNSTFVSVHKWVPNGTGAVIVTSLVSCTIRGAHHSLRDESSVSVSESFQDEGSMPTTVGSHRL